MKNLIRDSALMVIQSLSAASRQGGESLLGCSALSLWRYVAQKTILYCDVWDENKEILTLLLLMGILRKSGD